MVFTEIYLLVAEEKDKVHQLSLQYDFECKRRLDTLESIVQTGMYEMYSKSGVGKQSCKSLCFCY